MRQAARTTTTASSRAWRARAACGEADPALFDPDESPVCVLRRAAVEYCMGCPVRAPCLAEGVELGDVGVRGGMLLTPRRKSLRHVKCHCEDCEPPRADAEPPDEDTIQRQAWLMRSHRADHAAYVRGENTVSVFDGERSYQVARSRLRRLLRYARTVSRTTTDTGNGE